VDDLYFERGRSSRRVGRGRRMRQDDPNQMDLFTGSGQKSFETANTGDANVMTVAEQGAGSALGPATAQADPAAEVGRPKPDRSPKRKTARKPQSSG
jgi:hypothetical protein